MLGGEAFLVKSLENRSGVGDCDREAGGMGGGRPVSSTIKHKKRLPQVYSKCVGVSTRLVTSGYC